MNEENEIKAGEYYLGDPCYCFAHGTESWRELLNSCRCFEYTMGILNNSYVLAFNTMYGDGTYIDNNGYNYPVDSGLIGLVPVNLIEENSTFSKNNECGRIVEFKKDFICTNINGCMTFNDIIIETNDDDESYQEEAHED